MRATKPSFIAGALGTTVGTTASVSGATVLGRAEALALTIHAASTQRIESRETGLSTTCAAAQSVLVPEQLLIRVSVQIFSVWGAGSSAERTGDIMTTYGLLADAN